MVSQNRNMIKRRNALPTYLPGRALLMSEVNGHTTLKANPRCAPLWMMSPEGNVSNVCFHIRGQQHWCGQNLSSYREEYVFKIDQYQTKRPFCKSYSSQCLRNIYQTNWPRDALFYKHSSRLRFATIEEFLANIIRTAKHDKHLFWPWQLEDLQRTLCVHSVIHGQYYLDISNCVYIRLAARPSEKYSANIPYLDEPCSLCISYFAHRNQK